MTPGLERSVVVARSAFARAPARVTAPALEAVTANADRNASSPTAARPLTRLPVRRHVGLPLTEANRTPRPDGTEEGTGRMRVDSYECHTSVHQRSPTGAHSGIGDAAPPGPPP